MHHAPKFTSPGIDPALAQDCGCVVFGFACVNDHWQSSLDRLFQLAAEDVALHIAGAVIVKVVETDLPPPEHFRVKTELEKLPRERVVVETRFVGMQPDRSVYERKLIG